MKPPKGTRLPRCAHPALRKAKRFDKVHVSWRDSCRVNLGWTSASEYQGRALRLRSRLEETTGFLVAVNDAYVVVALSISRRAKHAADAMVIPHEAVRELRVLD